MLTVEPVVDVVVVGAGPAGLAAATTAAAAGVRVVLLDEQARPGGQYWRHGPAGLRPDHHDLRTWSALAGALAVQRSAGRLEHRSGVRVWRVEPLPAAGVEHAATLAVHVVATGADGRDAPATIPARAVVVATGAHDRVLPFPGWDLPGVLTPGGVQALLKEHGVRAGRRVVVAGTGPFLLPVAVGLLRAGAQVPALAEAGDGRGWLSGLPAVARAGGKVAEAAGYAAVLARHRVRPLLRHVVVAAHGTDRVDAVTLARVDAAGSVVPGSERRVACDAVAVGWGFTARAELALAAGARATTGPDGGTAVAADASGRTTVPGLLVAGELLGVGGAPLAVVTGRLAGAAAAGTVPDPADLGRADRLRAFAAVLHAAHPLPAGWTDRLTADTLVCRCEEVPLSAVTEAVDVLGATDARTVKLLTRCGMGWCQGRMCGEAVTALVARRTGRDGDGPDFAARPVAVPLTLGTLAASDDPTTPTTLTAPGGSDDRT